MMINKLVFDDGFMKVRWTDENATSAGFVFEQTTNRPDGVWLSERTVERMVEALQNFDLIPVAKAMRGGSGYTRHICPECADWFIVHGVHEATCPYCKADLRLEW